MIPKELLITQATDISCYETNKMYPETLKCQLQTLEKQQARGERDGERECGVGGR